MRVVGEGVRLAAILWGQGWDVCGLGTPVKTPVCSLSAESQQGTEPGHRAPQEEDV